MELTMRRCTPKDLAALRALSLATFAAAFGHLNTPENMAAYCAQAFGEESLRRQMDTQGTSFWFLEADGATTGYMKLNAGAAQTEEAGDGALEIERIYVSAAFQGHGLGAFMIGRAADLAREQGKSCLWLGVWEHNARAIRFYEAHGFVRCGSHVFYLGDEEQTDIIMRRNLSR
jgi:ribosomal protein S18 acetylase RimI-like enzyme